MWIFIRTGRRKDENAYIDMHCDSLLSAAENHLEDIYDNPAGMVDIKRLRQESVLAQFFAIFFPPQQDAYMKSFASDEAYFDCLHHIFENTLRKYPEEVIFAGSAKDILDNQKKNCLSAFLTLEDGRIVDGRLENLQRFYDMGVRLITLTWNYENCFGFPNSGKKDEMEKGLKKFGFEAVAEMNRLGILVDVSHLSDGGFYDVAKACKRPFVASHSNARAIAPHPRNLTDDMIRVLAEHGGVAGLNLEGYFLNPDLRDAHSTVDRMVQHVQHMMQTGGEDLIAIGTDLDGIEGQLEIAEPSKMELLFSALQKSGFSQRQLDKFMSGNVLRVLQDGIGS